MNIKESISTKSAREIIERRAAGEDLQAIVNATGVPLKSIENLLGQVSQMFVSLEENRKPSYQLTTEDKSSGGRASQRSRSKQRAENFSRMLTLLKGENKAIEMGTVIYFVQRGSQKEFSITIQNRTIGEFFLKALLSIGTPLNSINFNWRAAPRNKAEESDTRLAWGSLGSLIKFPAKGSSQILRLHVSSFQIQDRKGSFKVSSRSLALAFLEIGKETLKNVKN